MELLAKMANGFQPLVIFEKYFILAVRLGSVYASGFCILGRSLGTCENFLGHHNIEVFLLVFPNILRTLCLSDTK